MLTFFSTCLSLDTPIVELAAAIAASPEQLASLVDPGARAVVLDYVRQYGFADKLAEIEQRAAATGVHIRIERQFAEAGQMDDGLHFDGIGQVTLAVFPRAPGCAPWTGGHLCVAPGSDTQTTPAEEVLDPVPTAPRDDLVYVALMLGTTWHRPTPSVTGTYCCIKFHVGSR